ncbi:calcium-binding protein [Pseudomonas sp. COW5]|uniref:beta strand repeat-containing protein n=1 Tax=Pseudomonas sp. COW5 TaxID=2981253 RepID=UPI002245B483|nr:calcium-binding protein [Pseudomonas sp. COW5]MCX2541870.1 calcium-binding protein [Pseudomonas sp. COW5]
MAVINGTNGADTLNGTSGDDEINGLGGNDVIIGSAGADKIDGGAAFDTVDYSASPAGVNVDIRPGTGLPGTGGDAQGDTLTGIEKVIGSAFNDTFTTEASLYATYEGGAGDDIYYVNGGGVTIIEQAGGGNDEVRVSWKDHTLAANIERLTYVGTGSFTGVGNASDNIITGGANNDILKGGGGADQFFGGAGRDTVSYDDSTVAVSINLKTGVNSGIAAGDTYNSIEVIAGSNYNDTFVVDSRITAIDGGAGFDTVDYSTSSAAVNVDIRPGTGLAGVGGDSQGVTLTGIEKVIGSAFNDTFTTEASLYATYEGGAGDDTYYVNGGGVTIIEQAGGGNDEVRVSWKDHTLAANIERLTYVGTGSFTGVGNDSDNIITGGAGNDIFKGGGGADQFIGGAGMDTVSYDDSTVGVTLNLKTGVNSGIAAGDVYDSIEAISGSKYNDTFIADGRVFAFNGGLGGFDTVDYSSSSAAVNVDIRPGTGLAGVGGDAQGDTLTEIDKVIGSSFNDTFTAAAISFATFEGGAGDDIYYVNGGGVTIIEQAGGGNDEVRVSWKDHTLAANIERLTYVGTGSFTGVGNDSDNIITGGAGNDIFKGGGGADQFIGGAGMDTVSYDDSTTGVSINLKTGVNSGIAAGDTYNSIEAMTGSKYNDVFVGNSAAIAINGGLGLDMVSYESSDSAVTIDLKTNANAGDAAGDTFAGIEIFQGSRFADTFLGSTANDNFVGGAGADVFDGREGIDTVWYANNATAVNINLQTGVSQGGDAEGDVFINIESLIGTNFNDTLIGNAAANGLEGGLGNDVIYGGDGNDVIYGSLYTPLGPFAVNVAAGGPQADLLYGGNGDDVIVGAPDDRGTQAFGEAGNDTITVGYGMADGGEGNDTLTGIGAGYSLFGGAGADKLVLVGGPGSAFGGEDNDTYIVNTTKLVTIQDTGTSSGDTLILTNISTQQLLLDRVGNDLFLHQYSVFEGQTPEDGVRLKDWFAGFNNIEYIQTSDGKFINLPTGNDGFAMFG